MNNYPQKDLDAYTKAFSDIIEWFKDYLPNNFDLKFSKIRDFISQDEIFRRFELDIPKLRVEWESLPTEEKNFRLTKAERNYKDDLSRYSEKDKTKMLLNSSLIHDAFIFGNWDDGIPWAFDKLMIAVGNRYTGNWGIHIKSSRSSTVQFWTGIGVLRTKDGDYLTSSLTYEQYSEVKIRLKAEDVALFPKTFKNLNEILTLADESK